MVLLKTAYRHAWCVGVWQRMKISGYHSDNQDAMQSAGSGKTSASAGGVGNGRIETKGRGQGRR